METLEVWRGRGRELISPKINLHFLKIIVHVIFFCSCSYICAAHVLLAHFNKIVWKINSTLWDTRVCLLPSHLVFWRGRAGQDTAIGPPLPEEWGGPVLRMGMMLGAKESWGKPRRYGMFHGACPSKLSLVRVSQKVDGVEKMENFKRLKK